MKYFYTFLFFAFACQFSVAQVQIGTTNYSTPSNAILAINGGSHTGAVVVKIIGNTNEVDDITIKKSGVDGANYTSITISPFGGQPRTILLSGLELTANQTPNSGRYGWQKS